MLYTKKCVPIQNMTRTETGAERQLKGQKNTLAGDIRKDKKTNENLLAAPLADQKRISTAPVSIHTQYEECGGTYLQVLHASAHSILSSLSLPRHDIGSPNPVHK